MFEVQINIKKQYTQITVLYLTIKLYPVCLMTRTHPIGFQRIYFGCVFLEMFFVRFSSSVIVTIA